MPSLDAAPQAASSPRIPGKIVKRELLWSGGVIQVKVPVESATGCFKQGEKEIRFLRFARHVKGGVVNFFVHDAGDLELFLGQKITAEVRVYRKDYEDGRKFLYIDLLRVVAPQRVTHRLAVMPGTPGMQVPRPEGSVVFETPLPLHGAIVIAAPDQNMDGTTPEKKNKR